MKVRDGFVLREVGGQPVVVSVGPASQVFNGMIKLNGTGAFLFEKMQDETTEDALVEALMEKYDVEEELARNDVKNFVDTFRKARIIEEL